MRRTSTPIFAPAAVSCSFGSSEGCADRAEVHKHRHSEHLVPQDGLRDVEDIRVRFIKRVRDVGDDAGPVLPARSTLTIALGITFFLSLSHKNKGSQRRYGGVRRTDPWFMLLFGSHIPISHFR